MSFCLIIFRWCIKCKKHEIFEKTFWGLPEWANLDKQKCNTIFNGSNPFSNMKLTPIKDWISAPLLIPGLVFLLVNTSTSYDFYHVNSYKIVLVILGITFLAFRNIPFFPNTTDAHIPWKIWGVIAIPLLATFPGLILHQWNFNYNFRYELATNLILFLWVIYLYRNVRQEEDLGLLMFFIGIAILYNGCWSILEKTGLHPSAWNEPVQMVKATFGHRNYFSGFLIILLPTMLIFAVPEKIFGSNPPSDQQKIFTRSHQFYILVFLFGGASLILAQTRAAITAFLLSLALVSFLYIHFFAPRYWRRRILILFGIGVFSVVSLGIVVYLNPDMFQGSRFANLFTLKAWLGRLLPWDTAVSSIKASPLVGFGLGSSYNLFFSFVDPDAKLFHFEDSYNHAHSEILEYLQESGIIGLVAFVIFWIYLVYLLVRLLRNPDASVTQLKLGIGIVGGMLAYHIHGSFSVAPRMMVMKLPIYTLIALTLILNQLRNETILSEQNSPTLWNKIISGLPTLVILMVIWVIFLPWAAGQYEFAKISRQPLSYVQARKIERLVKLSPDIYALDHLSRLQLKYRKLDGLKNTLNTIERIIPRYRNLEYKKALHAALSGDTERAKQLGLLAQQHDRYRLPTIDLLMNLSFQIDDPLLFKDQFRLYLRKHAFSHRLVESLNANDVLIQFLPIEEPLNIFYQKNKLTFQWSEKLINLFFTTARKNRTEKKYSTKERQRYGAFLMQLLGKDPYFQLNVQEADKDESRSLQDAANAYFSLDKEWQKRKRKMEIGYQTEMRRTLPAERRELYFKQTQVLETIGQQVAVKMGVIAKRLRGKTDWDLYTRKQKFISVFTGRFNGIIFPAKP